MATEASPVMLLNPVSFNYYASLPLVPITIFYSMIYFLTASSLSFLSSHVAPKFQAEACFVNYGCIIAYGPSSFLGYITDGSLNY